MIRLASILLMILIPVAQAQVGLPNVRLPVLPQVPLTATVTDDARTDLRMLRDVRRLTVRDLIRRNRAVIQADRNGAAIVRGEILAVSPAQAAIDAAQAAGFTVLRTRVLDGLDAQIVVLGVPPGMDTLRALEKLRALAPSASFDYNHIYTSSGTTSAPPAGAAALGANQQTGVPARAAREQAGAVPPAAVNQQAGTVPIPGKIGLIDSGVDVAHPVFEGVSVHQHGCSAGPVAEAHGTAVASLMIGRSADFRGADPGAELYAADVYCGLPAGGPAAPPLYPASYPGVVGVTAVDTHRRVLFEAGRGPQVRFAAPGADMAAAKSVQTFALVRGTSFAAPIVAGLLAARLQDPDPTAAQRAVDDLAQRAVDLGAAGPDPVYGLGLVGGDLAPEPRLAAAHAR